MYVYMILTLTLFLQKEGFTLRYPQAQAMIFLLQRRTSPFFLSKEIEME